MLPLCEAASQGARDAAVGIVLDVRSAHFSRRELCIQVAPMSLAMALDIGLSNVRRQPHSVHSPRA